MKALGEHNQERWDEYNAMQESRLPHANGIACPVCGKELWDSDPTVMLTSDPPQMNVHCPACGYVGYRLA